MSNEEKISIRKYADSLNINEKAVRKARDAGLLGDGWDAETQKIIPSLADAAWGHKHKVIKKQAGVSRAKANEKRSRVKPATSKTKAVKNTVVESKSKPEKPNIKSKNKSAKGEENTETIIDGLQDDEAIDSEEKLEKIKITPATTIEEAAKYSEIFEAALLRLKLLEQQGILVKKADVDKQLFGLASIIKRKFLNLPKRVIEEVRAAPTTVDATNIMLKEINETLSSFSKELEKQMGNTKETNA